MRLLVIATAVLTATLAWGQAPPSQQMSPEQIQTQLNQVGCNAITMTSAQTIANLQKQIADLKAKADPPGPGHPLPPPKSGQH